MSALYRRMSKKRILELQGWAKEEFFRQQNEKGLNYLICKKRHPIIQIRMCRLILEEATRLLVEEERTDVRIHLCKLITDEALEEIN